MTVTSDPILIGNKSFLAEIDNNSAIWKRISEGRSITQEEKDTAGKYWDSSDNTIDYAKIYDLDFGPNYLEQLGASDDWMIEALSNPSYKDAFKKATGKVGAGIGAASASFGNIAKKLWNPTPLNTNPNYKSTSSGGGSTLYYPINRDRKDYDYLQVGAYQYAPNKFGKGGSGITAEIDSESRNLKPKSGGAQKVFLPMQPSGLQEGNSVGWGQDSINAIEAAMANIAGSTVAGAAEDFSQAAANAIGSTGDAMKKLLGEGGITKDDVAAYFAGQATGKNVLTRTTGKVMNPNLELLFSGPALRSFNYNFRFTPREQKESLMVRRIIKFFKKSMAPILSKEGGLFLESPHVFKLKYIHKNGGQHPFLNKIKPCALQNFSVQYAPDGSYMTYKDGSMTAYNISLTFGEINPIYDKDIDEGSNDMGF